MRLSEPALKRELFRRGLLPEEIKHAIAFETFAFHQLGLVLHPGQLAFAGVTLLRRNNSDVARYLTLLLTSGNRAGKTVILAAIVIYSCLGKLNITRPDESDPASVIAWGRRPYDWWHFGIRQEVSNLLFTAITRILSGTHEGQKHGCPLTEAGPIADWSDDGGLSKDLGEYSYIKFRPEVGGAAIHFRTTAAKSLGQLGQSMNGISFDEAGIESNLDFLIKEVFDFRRLDTGGQLIMVSTPSEELGTAFADNWEKGNPLNKARNDSWFSMRMSTRDNLGFGLDQEMFDILTKDMDDRTLQQNVEGIFLQAKAAFFNGEHVEQCFIPTLPERAPPKPGLNYLQGVDPAKTQDSMWSITLALVPNLEDSDKPYLVGVRAEERKGQKSTEAMVTMVYEAYAAYERPARAGHGRQLIPASRCYTASDVSGFGGKMFLEALNEEVPNVTNVEFGGTVQKKDKMLGDLRTIIDEGRLLLPKDGIWSKVRAQLLHYRRDDRKITQDAVMALVCAIYLVRHTPTDGQASVPMDMSGSN